MMRTLTPLALVLALGVACSGDDSGATATTDAAEIEVENDVAPAVTQPEPSEPTTTDPPATAPPATDPPTTGPPATDPEPESGPPRLSGLASVELSTPYTGAGERPLLEWSSVDGADYYGVYLYAPDESIYWTWLGHETSVFVGGETQLSDTMPGPSVVDEMTWSVVAYDAELLPIAVSNVRPISP